MMLGERTEVKYSKRANLINKVVWGKKNKKAWIDMREVPGFLHLLPHNYSLLSCAWYQP